jgi:hypothetical protein
MFIGVINPSRVDVECTHVPYKQSYRYAYLGNTMRSNTAGDIDVCQELCIYITSF